MYKCIFWRYLVEDVYIQSLRQCIHQAHSCVAGVFCYSWCIWSQTLQLFGSCWQCFIVISTTPVHLSAVWHQRGYGLSLRSSFFSVCGWWSSLWRWWRLRKMARTSRQKTRIRTLPTRKPTSRNFCLSLCLDGQTGTVHRRNVIKVGNDHQTSMSAFIHLPPGDTWDQPDYTVIFRGFSVCLFV